LPTKKGPSPTNPRPRGRPTTFPGSGPALSSRGVEPVLPPVTLKAAIRSIVKAPPISRNWPVSPADDALVRARSPAGCSWANRENAEMHRRGRHDSLAAGRRHLDQSPKRECPSRIVADRNERGTGKRHSTSLEKSRATSPGPTCPVPGH
jgi:hypothetical protein